MDCRRLCLGFGLLCRADPFRGSEPEGYREQTGRIAETQAQIAGRQIQLAEETRRERVREAVGRFYRMAFDLTSELGKVDEIRELGPDLGANYEAHPRKVLRDASREFAPLGDEAVRLLNQLGMGLDEYL